MFKCVSLEEGCVCVCVFFRELDENLPDEEDSSDVEVDDADDDVVHNGAVPYLSIEPIAPQL